MCRTLSQANSRSRLCWSDAPRMTLLAAQGKLRLGEGDIDESFWALPAPRVAPELLLTTIEKERDED
jgi:hypothetical protein